jgi:hypothetical protein
VETLHRAVVGKSGNDQRTVLELDLNPSIFLSDSARGWDNEYLIDPVGLKAKTSMLYVLHHVLLFVVARFCSSR